MAQQEHWKWWGDAAGDHLGFSVAGAGDVDADGHGDVIVGLPDNDTNGPSAGAARVFSGRDGTTLHTFFGDGQDDVFGQAVAAAGDIDFDGYADLLVGAPEFLGAGGTGYVKVFSGQSGSELFTLVGAVHKDMFGLRVSGGLDVNGDGTPDVLAGGPENDTAADNAGMARLFSGKDGSVLYTFYGERASDYFGSGVALLGDLNQDGFGDFAIGAPNSMLPGLEYIKVYSGKDGSVLARLEGDQNNLDAFGTGVVRAGDVDGDGLNEFIVGAPGADEGGGDQSGVAWVYSGAYLDRLLRLPGEKPQDHWGLAVAGAGDFNGDGVADLVVGSYWIGEAKVYSGRYGRTLYSFPNPLPGTVDRFAISVGGAGDLDADGFDDIVIGNDEDDQAFLDAGAATTYRGHELLLLAEPNDIGANQPFALSVRNGPPGARLGLFVTRVDLSPPSFS
jgi:hypothetical protein